jgi:hypothetical protein
LPDRGVHQVAPDEDHQPERAATQAAQPVQAVCEQDPERLLLGHILIEVLEQVLQAVDQEDQALSPG